MSPRPVLFASLVVCLPVTAHAYIDPGSGMLLWQGLIAAVGAVLVSVRSPWQAIKRLYERIFKR